MSRDCSEVIPLRIGFGVETVGLALIFDITVDILFGLDMMFTYTMATSVDENSRKFSFFQYFSRTKVKNVRILLKASSEVIPRRIGFGVEPVGLALIFDITVDILFGLDMMFTYTMATSVDETHQDFSLFFDKFIMTFMISR